MKGPIILVVDRQPGGRIGILPTATRKHVCGSNKGRRFHGFAPLHGVVDRSIPHKVHFLNASWVHPSWTAGPHLVQVIPVTKWMSARPLDIRIQHATYMRSV